jgi:sigma-70-like protein
MDGETFVFERFYPEYRNAVLVAVHGLIDDWQQAEDVTQEAFWILHRKASTGETVRSPKAFVQSWAYYLALQRLRAGRHEQIPTDSAKLTYLIEHHLELGWLRSDATLEGILEAKELRSGDLWESLGYWGCRMIDAATQGVPQQLRRRLFALMIARNRYEALTWLVEQGDSWARSSVCMALTRYSAKIDAFLRKTAQAGPQSEEEEDRWPFFRTLCRVCPGVGVQSRPRQNTLAWLIRGLQRLDGLERRELVFRFFGVDPEPAGVAGALRKWA